MILFSLPAFATIPDELLTDLNQQIKYELDGAYTYLAVAQRMSEESFDGSAHWFTQQFYEELNHARKIMDFIQKQRGIVTFFSIDLEKNPANYNLFESFAASLSIEELQTERLRAIYEKAKALKAYESEVFLHYFLDEQVEEEDMFSTLLDKIEMVKDDPMGLLMMDAELGKRGQAIIFGAPAL